MNGSNRNATGRIYIAGRTAFTAAVNYVQAGAHIVKSAATAQRRPFLQPEQLAKNAHPTTWRSLQVLQRGERVLLGKVAIGDAGCIWKPVGRSVI